jgi:hypothetical protein
MPTESIPVAIALPLATPFSANPNTTVLGNLQCDADLTFGALITTSGGVPDNAVNLDIVLYTSFTGGQPLVPPSGDAVFIGNTSLMLTGPFIATANPNEYKCVSYTSTPIYINALFASVNPPIGCGVSWFVRGTQNITSVVLTQPTVQVFGYTVGG